MQAQNQSVPERAQAKDRLLTTSPFFKSTNTLNDMSRSSAERFMDLPDNTNYMITPLAEQSQLAPATLSQETTTNLARSAAQRLRQVPSLFSSQESTGFTSALTAIDQLRQNISRSSVSPDPDSQAPVSAMEIFDNLRNNVIPPKRELPFPRRHIPEKPRSASASDLPPLPKPTPAAKRAESTIKAIKPSTQVVETPAPKPAPKKRVAQRKAPVAKLLEGVPCVTEELPDNEPPVLKAKDTSKAIGCNSQEEELSPLAAKSTALSSHPVSATGLPTKATASKKRAAPARPASAAKRAKMVDQGTQTQTLSGRDHTIAIPSITTGRAPEPIIVEAPPAPPPETYLDMVDRFVMENKTRQSPKELWQTPTYIEATEEQRYNLLGDFICANLENEDFIKLCEDAGLAWRRIGLGM